MLTSVAMAAGGLTASNDYTVHMTWHTNSTTWSVEAISNEMAISLEDVTLSLVQNTASEKSVQKSTIVALAWAALLWLEWVHVFNLN